MLEVSRVGRVAEADGNRTRRRRVATSPIGFEVRGGHQARIRFRSGLYCNLGELQRFYEAGRIWVAPASELLDFHFVRTFLDFSARRDDGKLIIDIASVADPVGPAFTPTLSDLRGVSFQSEAAGPVELRLAVRWRR